MKTNDRQTERQVPTPSHNISSKDTHFQAEAKLFSAYLHNHIATAAMVSAATGIPHKNICRYKRDLEREGKLYEVEKATCKQTGFKAWYLTTNKALVPQNKPQP